MLIGGHDTQHNNIQHNGTQHNCTRVSFMLSDVAPLIVYPRLNKLASKRLHHFSLTRGDQAGGSFKAICTYQHQSNRQNNAVTTKKSTCPKHQPEAGSLNKSSCLAPAWGVTKFINITDQKSHFVVLLKSDLNPTSEPFSHFVFLVGFCQVDLLEADLVYDIYRHGQTLADRMNPGPSFQL